MWTLVVLCSVIVSSGVQGDNWYTTLAQPEETVTSDGSCGGYLYSSSGTFYSPGYPNNYPNSSECIWYLRFGSDIMQLEFPFISIENHTNCDFDAIYVYDGFNTAYRLLGKVCGNTTATFHSTGPYMTVRFKSDHIISSSGFRADYRVVARGSCRYNCGYQVGSCSCSSGCEWRGNCCPDYNDYCPTSTMGPDVTTKQPSCRYNCGNHMGSCSCSSSCQIYGNCCYDYYNYCPTSTRGPDLTQEQPSCRYNCGNHMGSCSCSSSCQYYGNCCFDYYTNCPPSTVSPDFSTPGYTSCGGYLYASNGYISSPNYPSAYPNNADCIWYIRPGRSVVQLQFSSVNIEHCGSSCSCDAVSVYDGSSTGSRLLGKVCGSNTATFHSTGSYLTVHFKSDHSVSNSGFRAYYQVVGSCRYNCGYQVGNCSCSSSCEWRGNCCPDYYDYCSTSTMGPDVTTAQPSCRYNCGNHMGSCSCSYSCQYYGNCCFDYYTLCPSTTPGYTSCGGYLYGKNGNFSSPNYPSAYPNNADCIWYIRPGQAVVELRFSAFNIENCGNCSCDDVSVYNGPDIIFPLLGKVCGRNTVTFHSFGPDMTVRFRSNSHGRYTGFQAFYEVVSKGSCRFHCGHQVGACSCTSGCQYLGNCCPDYNAYCPPSTASPAITTPGYTSCGGYLYGSNGNFSSPNYPSAYPHHAECIWYIRPGRSVVQLQFSSVNIENCPYCRCDSVSVYDGPSTSSRLLRKICGRNTVTFHSTSSYLTVRFRSNSHGRSTGFQAFYEVVSQGSCRYNCGYQVGNCSCSSSCGYRGNCCPDYYAYCPSTTASPATTDYTSCGGYLYGSNGTFSSPNYPYAYPHHADCIWYIRPGHSVVQLGFSSVNIEYCGSNCSCDAVSVYDGSSTSSRLLGKVCGSNTATFHSTGSYLTVRFRSDYSASSTGFHAYYQVVGSCRYNCGYQVGSCSCSSSCEWRGNCCPDYYAYCPSTTASPATTDYTSCGGYLYGSNGTFSSPNYPYAYPNNADCIWYIRPGHSVVQLGFSSVNIEHCGSSCSCDAVSVYDGSSTGSRLLGKVCGSNTATFHSTGSYLTVRFKSDISVSNSGFRAYYQVVAQGSCRYNCGYQVGACSCSSSCEWRGNCCYDYYSYCPSTTASPAIPTTAQPSCRYNCGWNLGSCSCASSCRYNGNCCHDYYHYCQSTTEWPVTAQPSCRYNCGWDLGSCSCTSSCRYNGNCCHDYYHYCSSWPTTATPCGGYLFGSGTFTSPNHPSYYPDNAYCTWRLTAPSDQRIFLAFTFLQLENCCGCDYIKVYDGSLNMGTVCNNSVSTFHSSSNSMTVVFRTDGSVVARGFKAEFISSLPTSSGQVTCSSDNMNIVVQRSYLNSLGYDGDSIYLNDQQCRPQVSRHQVIFSFPIEGCGNVKKIENGRVVYTNALWGYTSSYGEITRQVHLKLNVTCLMDQDSVSQIMYLVENRGNGSIVGSGKFNTSMNFYTSSSFYYQVTQVPYKVTLNQNLYVQVDLSRHSRNLVIFLDTCVTSPSPHDFQNRSYYLVRNGCPVDSTYRPYYTGLRPYARFTFKAFQFLRAAESVYIQCKVLICPASDSNSRCHNPPNCRKRVARDLGTEHDSQTLVLGPIQLKGSEKKEEGTVEQDKA